MGYENFEKDKEKAMGYRTDQQIGKLKIGMTQWEVITTLGGKSINIATKITAEGRTEVWLYPYDQILTHIEGSAASFSYGFGIGINRTNERIIKLTFLGDKLTVIEGV